MKNNVTKKQFVNNWIKKGKDPYGNKVEKLTLGGKGDSYNRYIEDLEVKGVVWDGAKYVVKDVIWNGVKKIVSGNKQQE